MGTENEGDSFLKSGCRRDKPLSRSCAGLRKKSTEKFMGLKIGNGSCRMSAWGLAEQRDQKQHTVENWKQAQQKPEAKAGENIGSKRGREWEEGAFGIRSLWENVGMKAQRQVCKSWELDKHKGTRNLAAEEQSLEVSVCNHSVPFLAILGLEPRTLTNILCIISTSETHWQNEPHLACLFSAHREWQAADYIRHGNSRDLCCIHWCIVCSASLLCGNWFSAVLNAQRDVSKASRKLLWIINVCDVLMALFKYQPSLLDLLQAVHPFNPLASVPQL